MRRVASQLGSVGYLVGAAGITFPGEIAKGVTFASVNSDGTPRGRGGYRWLCRARGVWRRGGSGEASVAAGGRAAAPGRVQVDDAPAPDAVGTSTTPVYKWGARRHR